MADSPAGEAGAGRGPRTASSGRHDQELVARLRAGDESAFRDLVAQLQGPLARFARSFSRNDSVIEEAVQETWLAVIKGIRGFEGRSPLRTWIFGILVNHARKLAVKAQKQSRVEMGLSPQAAPEALSEDDDREPGMGPTGMWDHPPVPWGLENPESALLARETLAVIEAALEAMPEAQRRVVLLRDVEGLGAEEVCNILAVSGTNERVLLHRGRARVRQALDAYLRGESSPTMAMRRQGTRLP